ncbi:MAG: DegQ family serine endoprotease [Rhodospirillaceae bacterium]|nr:DegQ family serine endoprotease [Rhodospirillaceae bacterium]
MMRLTRISIGIASVALLGTCAPVTTPKSGDATAAKDSHGPLPSARPVFARVSGDRDLADIAESAVDGVVNISSERVRHLDDGTHGGPFFSDPFFRRFFGEHFFQRPMPKEGRERSLGSGVLVSADGIVVTNHHVIKRADAIQVRLADERVLGAEVVGSDPETDLAVLRLKGEVGKLRPLQYGDSDKLRLGNVVLAIGNPFGVGQTVTMGIVSAKGRANMGVVDYEDFIQTDAAINPGNSGGALVNMRGELIGINTAILTRTGGYQGVGFAIPAAMVKTVVNGLVEVGEVKRGWLGVTIQEIDSDLASAFKLPSTKGVLVSDVIAGGPADKGGIRRGDVILSVSGQPVASTAELRNRVAAAGPEAKVDLGIIRGGQERTIAVELGLKQGERTQLGALPEAGALGGLSLAPLDGPARRRFEVPAEVEHGVVVIAVKPGSPAQRAGLRPGDVIVELGQEPVQSVEDFRRRYLKAGDTVVLLIRRGPATLFFALRTEDEP